jgi:membrane-bound lytic murein transglycosylase D
VLRLVGIALLLLFFQPLHAKELFPRPAELQPDVDFWVKVYTQVDTRSGYLHDSYDLTVIYDTLTLSGDYRQDLRIMRNARSRYAKVLLRLASDRTNLSAEEQRVLDLWGADVSSARLRQAAGDVRFQRGQSDRFLEGIVRSGEWNAYIDSVFAERGLPRELGILPHVESSFNPNAYSSAGAAGIWQFTRGTGRRYMKVDYVVDERMDPFVATVAAAQLLEHNHQTLGTWPLALTAYNHGAASMRRAVKKLGTTDIATIARNYKGRAFGFASRNFYVSFLAALEVSINPERYFGPVKMANPVRYAELELPEYISADALARAFGTDADALKPHNRALLDPIWLGKKRVPAGYKLRVPASLVNGDPEQLLAAIPTDQRFSEQTPDLFHKVVRGDTVSEIAARYGHSIREIAAMNGLNRRYQIRVGQVLRLPLPEGIQVATAETRATGGTVTVASAPEEASPRLVTVATAAVVPEPVSQPASEEQAEVADAAEPAAESIADDTRPAVVDSMTTAESGLGDSRLLADPSDYTVSANQTIEVQASETLGHYAEWLNVRASDLRRLNNRRYGRPMVIGERLKLDFSRVDPKEFERRRLAFQQELQQAFFMNWHIASTHKHVVSQGDSLWEITRQRYKVPLWLLRQYNPDLDPDRLRPGMVILVPELVKA